MQKKYPPSQRARPSLQLPTRRYSRYLGKIVPAAGKLGRIQWVLSRPFCRFCRFDLNGVPKPQRDQALDLQIRQWTPFANTGRYLVWMGDHALVWAWDADSLSADLAQQSLHSNRVDVLPESLLHAPLAAGLRLMACMDGVEGQMWREGFLVHSRWWPDAPSEAEWFNFQRDAGSFAQLQNAAIPPITAPDWLSQPWAKKAPSGYGSTWAAPYEARLVSLGILILAGMTSWYGIQLVKTNEAIELRKSELKIAETAAQPVLAARQQTLDALSRIKRLQKTGLYPDPLSVMATIAKLLPRNTSTLKEWDYRDDKLKITVSSTDKLSSSLLVKALLDSGWFGDVRATPTADPAMLALSMDIKPWAEIKEQTPDESRQKTVGKGETPGKPPGEETGKALGKAPDQAPVKALVKTPDQTPVKAPGQAPVKAPVRAPSQGLGDDPNEPLPGALPQISPKAPDRS